MTAMEWFDGLPSAYAFRADDLDLLIQACHEYHARILKTEIEYRRLTQQYVFMLGKYRRLRKAALEVARAGTGEVKNWDKLIVSIVKLRETLR